MESRQSYILENPQSSPVYAVEGYDRPAAAVYPILAAGDVCGAVILSAGEDRRQPSEADRKLIAAAAMFLGRRWRNKKRAGNLACLFHILIEGSVQQLMHQLRSLFRKDAVCFRSEVTEVHTQLFRGDPVLCRREGTAIRSATAL